MSYVLLVRDCFDGHASGANYSAVWQHFCDALKTATFKEHKDVMEQLPDGTQKPYTCRTMTVQAQHPLGDATESTTTILVPDYYDIVWQNVKPNTGGRYRLLIRGAPGIGKTTGLGLMYLLRELLLELPTNDRLQHVVVTLPKGDGGFNTVVVNKVGIVTYFFDEGRTPAISALCYASTTARLMDDTEHGPNVQLVQGVLIMLTSPDEANYPRMKKDSDRQLWCPALSTGGRVTCRGVPVELEAMRRYCFSSVIDEDALARRYNQAGPIPRILKLPHEEYEGALAELRRIVSGMTAVEVDLAMHSTDSGATTKQRIKYQVADPKTLEVRGSALVPEALRYLLNRRSKLNVLEQAALVERQVAITHCHTSVGKAFEELLLEYLSRVNRTVWSCPAPPPRPAKRCLKRTELTLPHGVKNEGSSSSPDTVMTPQFEYVRTFHNLGWERECFVASRRSNEPIIDFVYISSGGSSGGSGGSGGSGSGDPTSIFLGQVTFNPNHSSDGDKTFLLLQKILTKAYGMDVPGAIAAVKAKQLRLVYAIVTNYASAHLMTARKLQSEVQDKEEKEQRTALLSKLEQLVLTPPDNFLREVGRASHQPVPAASASGGGSKASSV